MRCFSSEASSDSRASGNFAPASFRNASTKSFTLLRGILFDEHDQGVGGNRDEHLAVALFEEPEGSLFALLLELVQLVVGPLAESAGNVAHQFHLFLPLSFSSRRNAL